MKIAINFVRALCASALWFALPLAASTLDPSGDLDTSFATGGKASFNFSTVIVPADSRAAILQPNGKVVIGGGSNNGLLKDFVLVRLNNDGTTDTSFGTGGVTSVDMGFDDHINAMAQNSDGSRFCGGGITSVEFGVACFTINGTLDTTFNGNGISKSNAPGSGGGGRILGMTFDRSNRLVAIGYGLAGPGGRDMFLRRYNTDGTPDTSFGSNSWVEIDVGGGLERGFDVAVLKGASVAQDQLVAVGTNQTRLVIALLNANGTLDTSSHTLTGTTGIYSPSTAPLGITILEGVAIDSSGNIFVTGQGPSAGFHVLKYSLSSASALASTGNLGTTGNDVGFRVRIDSTNRVYAGGTAGDGSNFAVARMSNDLGTIDYHTNTDFGGSDFAQDLVIEANGFVTAVGGGGSGVNSIDAARYKTDGTLDTNFANNGLYHAAIMGGSTDESRAFGVQSDGKLVVAGTTLNSAGDYDLLVTRVNTDGTRDNANWAAGTAGWDSRTFATGSADSVSPNGVAIDSNGKAVVVGATSGTGFTDFFAVRYSTNGTLDTSFGGTGIVRNNWGTNSVGTAVAIDASNNVIVGGDITLNGDFTFARLKASDGSLDTSFNSTGKQTVDIATGKSDVLKALAVDPSGRILAAGQCLVHVGSTDIFKMCLARLNNNGSLDTSFDGDGKVLLNISGSDTFDIRSMQLLPDLDTASTTDYKIVVGGQFVQASPSQSMWLIARLNMDGSLDTSFNGSGYKTLVPGAAGTVGAANSVALQYDEKIVVFGESSAPDPQNACCFLSRQITVARLNWDGSLDTTYGDNGFRYATQGSDPGEAYQGFVYPQSNATLKGRAVATNFIIASDFALTRYREDPAPISGASAPDLDSASDSGRSNSDNITKDTTPTFTGTCSRGETVYLLVNAAQTVPRTRQICPVAGTYTLTPPALSGIPRTTYSITTRTQSGIGDSAISGALSVTVDAEINPVLAITNPAAGSNQTLNPTINGTSAEATADIVVTSTGAGSGCASFQAAGDGTWSCTSGLTQGAQTISVVQTDVAGNVASAVTRSFNVKAPTATTLVSSANPSTFGQPVTFTATVVPNGPHNLVVTGTTVRFLVDGAQVAAPALDVNGQATLAPSGLGLAVGTHTVQAVYDENANWLASASSVTPDQLVQKADTTTTLSSSANSSVFGQSVTFTATIATVAPGAGTSTGSVTFLDGAVPIGSGPLTSGVATFTTSTLTAASHAITTSYAGDANHNGSGGSLIGNPQVVNKANATTTVTSSQNPSALNQSVTFTATLTALAPGAGIPTGSITFLDNGGPIGTGTLGAGVATLSTSALSVGSHTITTSYAGDGNFNLSTGSLTGNPQVVKKLPTTTNVTSSQNPSKFGQSVTFVATVAPTPPGTGTPSGTVTFLDGGSSIGTGTLDGSGMASLTLSNLASGTHNISASYAADATFDVSTGALTGNPQIVDKADTAFTSLTSNANPSAFGQAVTFTATIAATAPGAGTPTGSVTFNDGAATLGTASLSGGTATLTISTLAVGAHTVSASYGGDANFSISNASPGISQFVNKADTTSALASSQNPSLPGQSVTFTATVTAVAPGSGTPTGTINFLDGGNPLGVGTLSAGVATFTTSTLTPGSHTITSSYVGDANFTSGTGSLTGNPQVVSKATTSTSIDSVTPSGPITLGSSVSVMASVAVPPPGTGTPSGTIAINDGGVGAGDSCTITLPGNSCTLTPSAAGNHVLVASYSGDGTFLASTSAGKNLSVTPPTRTITANASANGSITPTTQYVVDGNSASFTVTPNDGYTAVMSTTCPEGLGSLSNNIYTTLAISADCDVTATFAPAAATLTLVVTDNRDYARYGGLVNFVVTVNNSSGSAITGLHISGSETSLSADMDTAGGHWLCFGSATQCTPSGDGPFDDSNVSVPANGSVSWLVTVPVLSNAPDPTMSYTVTLSGAGPDVAQSDVDTLVIYRDGFDAAYSDGAHIAAPIIWDGDATLTLSPSDSNSGTIESVLSGKSLDGSGFRIEQVDTDQQIWMRAVAIDRYGVENATAWTRVAANAQLLLSIVTTNGASALIVVGGDHEIDCTIAQAVSWQILTP